MDTIMVICAFLLMTTAMLVVSIRKFNKLTEDIATIDSDVCELQAWVSIAEDEQEEKNGKKRRSRKKRAQII